MRRVRIGRTAILAAAVAFGCSLVLPELAAAQKFPSTSIRIVTGFAAGNPLDFSARTLASGLSGVLGQSVIVENRPGAGTNLATAMVARAPADGHTLLMGATANAINATTSSNLTFDFVKDFAPITMIGITPTILIVNPSLGVKTVQELVALAKSKPGTISFGYSGQGSATHLSLELFKRSAGLDIATVPYTGIAPALSDLLTNRIQGYFSPASPVLSHISEGKLVGLATTGAKRSPIVPFPLPTMIEAGFPDIEIAQWFGILAPAGTPPDVIDTLLRASHQAMQTEEARKSLEKYRVEAVTSTPAEFASYIRSEVKRWGDIARSIGFRQ